MLHCISLTADPVITSFPSNMNVITPKSVTLQCAATGIPTPGFNWEFNNNIITIDNTKYILSSTGSLTVQVISINDQGTYKCIVSNIHSSVSTSAVISVQGN